jgi:hypothetical protein
MADTKTTGLDANTTPAVTDLIPIVDDPGGTAVLQKMALSYLLAMAVTNVVVQVISAGTTTYTPTTGMKKVLAILVGPGGNGGAVTGVDCVGGGGGGGGTCIRLCTAAEIGASSACVVGTAGTATTLADVSMSAGPGGNGASSADSTTLGTLGAGGAGGTSSGGDLNITGQAGFRGVIHSTTAGLSGAGGNSMFGGGASQKGPDSAGAAGGAYGGGGSGGACSEGTDRAGGGGANGIMYMIEFLNV